VRQWTLNGPEQELFDKGAVALYLRLNTTKALDRLIAAGLFPRGIRMGGKRGKLVWTGLDIAAYLYIQGRIHEGDADLEPGEAEDGDDGLPPEKPQKK